MPCTDCIPRVVGITDTCLTEADIGWYSTYSCSGVQWSGTTTWDGSSPGFLVTTLFETIGSLEMGINTFSVQVRFQSTDF
jgi:hypothetical protein